jgi:hypothetical protein
MSNILFEVLALHMVCKLEGVEHYDMDGACII